MGADVEGHDREESGDAGEHHQLAEQQPVGGFEAARQERPEDFEHGRPMMASARGLPSGTRRYASSPASNAVPWRCGIPSSRAKRVSHIGHSTKGASSSSRGGSIWMPHWGQTSTWGSTS